MAGVVEAIESFAWNNEVVVRGERRRDDAPIVKAVPHLWIEDGSTPQEIAEARGPLLDRAVEIAQQAQEAERQAREARIPRVRCVEPFSVPFSELVQYDDRLPSWGRVDVAEGDLYEPNHALVKHSPSRFVSVPR